MSCPVSVMPELVTHEICYWFVLQVLLESPEQSVVRDSEGSMQAGKTLNVGEWDIWTEIIDLEPDSERVTHKHSWSLSMQFRIIYNSIFSPAMQCAHPYVGYCAPLWKLLKGFCSWG